MPQKKLISKADFARRAGVTRTAVTNACKGPLKEILNGKSIDIDHPKAIEYIGSKRAAKTTDALKTVSQSVGGGVSPIGEIEQSGAGQRIKTEGELVNEIFPLGVDGFCEKEDVGVFLDMSLRDIVNRFGTREQFKEFMTARKTIEDIKSKELSNLEKEGILISRELVKTHMFGFIEGINSKLLTDTPKTVAHRLIALLKSGEGIEEAEKLVSEILSTQIKDVKKIIRRSLKEPDARAA